MLQSVKMVILPRSPHFIYSEANTQDIQKRNVINKTGPLPPGMGMSEVEQRSFLYLSHRMYNVLGPELSLIRNIDTFRVNIRRFYTEKEIHLTRQKDNIIPNKIPMINMNNIMECSQS